MAPKQKKSEKDEDSTVQLHVVMLNDGIMFKHRVLFVDIPNNPTILNVQGTAWSWRYEQKTDYDPRASPDVHAEVHIGTISKSRVPELIKIAEELPLKQTDPTWNCQKYVLDLIIKADENLFDIPEDEFRALCQRMDGLV